MNYKSIDELKKELASNQDLQNEFKENPIATMEQIQQSNPLDTDKWIYRIIVLSLGISIVSILIGVIILVGNGAIKNDTGVPTILTAIGSAAIGALAGLLAPTPQSS